MYLTEQNKTEQISIQACTWFTNRDIHGNMYIVNTSSIGHMAHVP